MGKITDRDLHSNLFKALGINGKNELSFPNPRCGYNPPPTINLHNVPPDHRLVDVTAHDLTAIKGGKAGSSSQESRTGCPPDGRVVRHIGKVTDSIKEANLS